MDDLFAKFWAAYPARNRRKLGKAQAQELFKKLSDEDQALCVQAAANYAKGCTQTGDEFVPMPRDAIRFLKGDWWRDWLDEAVVLTCDFRVQPPCEQPVVAGGTACEFHTAYRQKLAKLRQG
jgi:hypothetical protein